MTRYRSHSARDDRLAGPRCRSPAAAPQQQLRRASANRNGTLSNRPARWQAARPSQSLPQKKRQHPYSQILAPCLGRCLRVLGRFATGKMLSSRPNFFHPSTLSCRLRVGPSGPAVVRRSWPWASHWRTCCQPCPGHQPHGVPGAGARPRACQFGPNLNSRTRWFPVSAT